MKYEISALIEALRSRSLSPEREQAVVLELLATEEGERALFAEDPALANIALVVPPRPLPTSGRQRLLAAIAGQSRFAAFADGVARLLGVSAVLAQRLLDGIDRASSWTASPWPGVELFHLEGPLGGAAIAAEAVVGFVRLAPGAAFPSHTHLGQEQVLIVQGGLRDSSGAIHRAGDTVVMGAGSEHHFAALEGAPLVYLVVIRDGVRIGDVDFRPGSADV